MTVLEALVAARQRIADPVHWTSGTAARSASGRAVTSRSQRAVKWCALGAIYSIECDQTILAVEVLDAAALEMDYGNMTELNDVTDHVTVMQLYDRAILSLDRGPRYNELQGDPAIE